MWVSTTPSAALLREIKPVLIAALPEILERFYKATLAIPELGKKFAGPDRVRFAKDSQLKHWAHLFEGRFDDKYREFAVRIGQVHHKIGLDPELVSGGLRTAARRAVGRDRRQRRRPDGRAAPAHRAAPAGGRPRRDDGHRSRALLLLGRPDERAPAGRREDDRADQPAGDRDGRQRLALHQGHGGQRPVDDLGERNGGAHQPARRTRRASP